MQNKGEWMKSHLYKDLELTTEEVTWIGTRFLGHGSYGAAGLWVNCDARNTIMDRMVAKEASPNVLAWKCPDEWRDKLPREIRMHELIDSTRTESSHLNLIKHRGYRLMMEAGRYRLFLDLCDGGPLADALRNYWHDPARQFNKRLPEWFIWHLFKGMVDACLVLEQGDLHSKVDGWKPLVHNDLHLGNVMLRYGGEGYVSIAISKSSKLILTTSAGAGYRVVRLWKNILRLAS